MGTAAASTQSSSRESTQPPSSPGCPGNTKAWEYYGAMERVNSSLPMQCRHAMHGFIVDLLRAPGRRQSCAKEDTGVDMNTTPGTCNNHAVCTCKKYLCACMCIERLHSNILHREEQASPRACMHENARNIIASSGSSRDSRGCRGSLSSSSDTCTQNGNRGRG
jgi:hypothetical protein